MPKKKAIDNGEAVNISRKAYNAMVETMLELAFRGEQQEAVIMRAAKAGDIHEVTKEITRRRMYAKKQGMVRATKPETDSEPKPKAKGKRKKKAQASAPPPPPPAGEGSEAAQNL